MTRALTLKCNYSFAPGFDWSAELTFKPLPRGFAVTGQLAEDEEAGVRRIVGKSSAPLTWSLPGTAGRRLLRLQWALCSEARARPDHRGGLKRGK